MSWRVHLTNQAIRTLHILPGQQPILAVWTRRDHVVYYDLETGAAMGEQTIPTPPAVQHQSDEWQEYAGALTGPRGKFYLPVVETALSRIFTTTDGKMRLYANGDATLLLEIDGSESALQVQDAERIIALDMDRSLGLIAALDDSGMMHLFQQDIHVGTFDLGLNIRPDLRPDIAVSQGGGTLFVTDGSQLILTDTSGEIMRRVSTHYYIARIASSPSGGMLVTSDIESGVIRVYSNELIPTHQRHAIDLLVAATQTQLLAELPPASIALSALAAHSKGIIAFAMSGVVCVTDVTEMNELPRPQPLL